MDAVDELDEVFSTSRAVASSFSTELVVVTKVVSGVFWTTVAVEDAVVTRDGWDFLGGLSVNSDTRNIMC